MKLLNQILNALRCGSWCWIKPLKDNDPLVHINALNICCPPSDHCLKTSSIFQLLQNARAFRSALTIAQTTTALLSCQCMFYDLIKTRLVPAWTPTVWKTVVFSFCYLIWRTSLMAELLRSSLIPWYSKELAVLPVSLDTWGLEQQCT